MNLFTPPIPDAAPDTVGTFRNRGAISAASQMAGVGSALSNVGRAMANSADVELRRRRAEADEWRRRQDQFALDIASANMDIAREKFEAEQEKRGDLGTFTPDGIGFQRAVTDYRDYLSDAIGKASENLPAKYSDMWRQKEILKNQEREILFEARMQGLETDHNISEARKTIRSVAYGDPDNGVAPNPQAAMGMASSFMEIIPAKMQKQFLDETLEDVFNAWMSYDPQGARQGLEKSKERFEAETYLRLSNRAKSIESGMADVMDKQKKERRRLADQSFTADVLATEASSDPAKRALLIGAIADAVKSDALDADTGRILTTRLTQSAKDENTDAARVRSNSAYGIMRRQTDNLLAGKRSYEEWKSIYNAHFMDLDKEDAESFLDQAIKGKRDARSTSISEARELAEKAMKPLYTLDDGKTTDDLGLDAEVGGIMRDMELLAERHFTDDKKTDLAAFRKEANQLIAEAYDRKIAGEKKAPGWASRWWSGVKEASGEVPQAVQPQTRPGYTKMTSPKGQQVWVPDGKVEEALTRPGWKKAQ